MRQNKTPQNKLDASAKQRAKRNEDPIKLEAHRIYMKEYASKNKERLNRLNNNLYNKNKIKIRLQRKGIKATPELILKLEEHSGLCDICNSSGDGRWQELSIDHCHETNQIRGMLCTNCNQGLGKFKDNIDYLNRAINYLIQYRKMLELS